MRKSTGVVGYVTDTLNGMATGLFASLIIGLIIKQIGTFSGISTLVVFGNIAQKLMGPAIGVGVSYAVGAPDLGIIAGIITGAIGAGSINFVDQAAIISIGEPVGAFIAGLIGAEASKLIEKRTKIDIILVPSFAIIFGGLAGNYISPTISKFMLTIGEFINIITEMHPLPMGILISLVMGILLTLPISSAAIAISLNLSGIAAGAATAGCAANMIGFAVASYEDNGIGGFIAQGIGTSMIQISNIFKKPIIWLPAILSSIVVGPISSVVFKLESNSIGAGMGTSGLVGQFAMIETMGLSYKLILIIILVHIIIPGLISYLFTNYLKRRSYIKKGDMKL